MNINLTNLSENNKKRYSYCLNLFEKIVKELDVQKSVLTALENSITNNKIVVLVSTNEELKMALSNLYTLYREKDKLSVYYCKNIVGERIEKLLMFNSISKSSENHEVIFFDGFNCVTDDGQKKILTEYKDSVLLSIFSMNKDYESPDFTTIDLSKYNEESVL